MSVEFEPSELKLQLQAALGLSDDDFGYHATDLYVLDKPGVMDWLKKNYRYPSSIKRFIGNEGHPTFGGKSALDIPFAGVWKKLS
jgi:hypothetical protein